MFRTSVRLVAALIVAVGLLVAPATGLSKSKSRKETKVSKKKPSSRDTKSTKSKKRDDSASKRKSSAKSSVKSSSKRRGKNEDDSSATRRRRAQPRPVVARNVSDDEDVEEVEEPAGPRPANRLVADIAPARVTQIQGALIQRGLLAGPPSGVYDQATFQAMSTFQSRNGWNPNGNPTADALKALGVPKNSGRSLYTPARVVEATAPPQ